MHQKIASKIPYFNRFGDLKGHFKIDVESFGKISRLNWFFDGAYICAMKNRKKIFLHRLVMSARKGQYVDHKNRDVFDNRTVNLRICTQSQNIFNSKKSIRNSSGIKGVHYNKRTGSYQVHVGKKHIGYFSSKKKAAEARSEAVEKFL